MGVTQSKIPTLRTVDDLKQLNKKDLLEIIKNNQDNRVLIKRCLFVLLRYKPFIQSDDKHYKIFFEDKETVASEEKGGGYNFSFLLMKIYQDDPEIRYLLLDYMIWGLSYHGISEARKDFIDTKKTFQASIGSEKLKLIISIMNKNREDIGLRRDLFLRFLSNAIHQNQTNATLLDKVGGIKFVLDMIEYNLNTNIYKNPNDILYFLVLVKNLSILIPNKLGRYYGVKVISLISRCSNISTDRYMRRCCIEIIYNLVMYFKTDTFLDDDLFSVNNSYILRGWVEWLRFHDLYNLNDIKKISEMITLLWNRKSQLIRDRNREYIQKKNNYQKYINKIIQSLDEEIKCELEKLKLNDYLYDIPKKRILQQQKWLKEIRDNVSAMTD